MSINSLIRDGRKRLKLSEEQFGKLFGVSRGTVQHWEREGGTAPNRNRQALVAEKLGITVAELMSGGTQSAHHVSEPQAAYKVITIDEAIDTITNAINQLKSEDRAAISALLGLYAKDPASNEGTITALKMLLKRRD